MAESVPSIGSMVHFVHGERHFVALVTDPAGSYGLGEPTRQALTVFPPGSEPFTDVAVYDPDGAPGTWHWPEYVPAKE